MTESNNKVGIDAGMLLLVDPCAIPAEVLEKILRPNGYGYTAGVLMEVPGGDCVLEIEPYEYGPLEVASWSEPCTCEGTDPECEICELQADDPSVRPWRIASEETVDMVLREWSR